MAAQGKPGRGDAAGRRTLEENLEVTQEAEVVWEYINHDGDQTRGDYGIYKIMTDGAGDGFNSVFRCVRYGADYSGFKGRDLMPKGKITEIHTKEPEKPAKADKDPGGFGIIH